MATKISELANGVTVYQVTDDARLKNNIYCERSYCSPDSRCFIYQRRTEAEPTSGRRALWEFVACDFGTWEERVLGLGFSYAEVTPRGALFYSRPAPGDERELIRVDLATGESHPVPIAGGVRPRTGMAVSADERYLAYGVTLGFNPQRFGVEMADLHTGERQLLCEDPYICNPHPQIEPSEGREVLIQHNRGCRFDADGKMLALLGEEGCTLFTVSLPGGHVTPLQVGPPYTPTCTGHEQWIGATKEVLLSVGMPVPDAVAHGNLLAVRAGQPARAVTRGYRFNHVHASVDGRFFCCDSPSTHEIVVGSLQTGRGTLICTFGPDPADAYAQYGQSSHAHPYLSPDLRWVVFNSCRTGRPEIHVARVPEEIVAELAT
jgi:hypothetical protein